MALLANAGTEVTVGSSGPAQRRAVLSELTTINRSLKPSSVLEIGRIEFAARRFWDLRDS